MLNNVLTTLAGNAVPVRSERQGSCLEQELMRVHEATTHVIKEYALQTPERCLRIRVYQGEPQ